MMCFRACLQNTLRKIQSFKSMCNVLCVILCIFIFCKAIIYVYISSFVIIYSKVDRVNEPLIYIESLPCPLVRKNLTSMPVNECVFFQIFLTGTKAHIKAHVIKLHANTG